MRSSQREIDRLIRAINPTPVQAPQPRLRLRQGVVSTVNPDGTVLVAVGGGSPAGPFSTLAGYRPRAGDTVSLLKNGPDWLVLGAIGSAPAVLGKVRSSQTLSVSSSTTTFAYPAYDIVDLDPYGMLRPATSTLRLYAPQDGWYEAKAITSWTSNSSGFRKIEFRLNGDDAQIVGSETRSAAPSTTFDRQQAGTLPFYMAKDDFVQARYQQNSGSSLNLNPSTWSTALSLKRVA